METRYYATPGMVKAFLGQSAKSENDLPEFPDALQKMGELGLLSAEPLPKPHLNGQMAKEEFIAAFDQIPFEYSLVMDILKKEHEQNQQIALPPAVDVACAQQIHSFGFTRQTLKNVFSFTYIFQGVCTISYDDVRIELKQSDIFIASPGFEYYIHTTPDTFALNIVVRAASFSVLFQDFLSSDLILSDYFRKSAVMQEEGNYCVIHGNGDDPELRFYLQSLACEYMDKHEYYSNSCAISLLKLFLARAYRKYHDRVEFYQQNFSGRVYDRDRIYHFIELHYQCATLDMLAKEFHFNKTYLSRYIHTHFNRTFMEILTELKMDHAREYLRKTNKSISEIATLTGYESLNHFSKTFKQFTGLTASEYRKKASI